MKNVFFAMFDNEQAAIDAIRGLREMGVRDEDLGIIVHRPGLPEDSELLFRETDARLPVAGGALVGALGGLLAGVVFGPAGLVGYGAIGTLLAGVAAGTAYGAMGGALAGIGLPDRAVEAWAEKLRQGRVLVTFTAADAEAGFEIERQVAQVAPILHRHQAA